jgi:predicted NAD/FAD-dependent oxidoreductase
MKHTKQSLPVAIIGAGLAGLSCARALQTAGVAVQLFDKSRGPAGRMSTRRGEGWQCDHGAQYFTARDPAFRAELARWQAAGVAAAWQPRLRVFGPPRPGSEAGETERFVGLPQMTSPARWLAQDLPLRLNATLQGLRRTAAGAWRLDWAEAALQQEFESQDFAAVLLALPAPQLLPLLQGVNETLLALAGQARMRGSWALMLRYERPLALDFDAAFVNEGPLRWLARDSSKPGRPQAGETWLLHAQAPWSEAHLEHSPEQVQALLLAEFVRLGARLPDALSVHRWRYADTERPLNQGCAWDAQAGLGLCGDWLMGGKVEGAWRSGQALAGAYLEPDRQTLTS